VSCASSNSSENKDPPKLLIDMVHLARNKYAAKVEARWKDESFFEIC
jgi:hypothetical protein